MDFPQRFAAAWFVLAGSLPAATLDYARDVRPILAENCFKCHGQDQASRKGKLRLDTRDGQAKPGVIVAGQPDDSELIARIFSHDEDEVMPPPEAKRTLSDAQKATLRGWIEEGAPFAGHWAFVAPVPPAPPSVRQADWPRGPLDRFVLARLEAEGLTPAPETDRAHWLRRVTLDLTGLPPTPAELETFLADQSGGAFATVVDRLLASSRFGERMAAEWLDVARYADTHGYQMDRPRAMWPYRDWVVDAFNRNLPYDRFLTEQIAGDLLPGATRSQKLATAFNRLHAQNEEGGIVDEEYRIAYVNDRVTTFGTAVLGLTLECARCHDHKFDPIPQRDFYALSAFFANIDEAGAIPYKNFSDLMSPPVLKLPDATGEAGLRAADAAVAAQEAALRRAETDTGPAFAAWLAQRGGAVPEVAGAVVDLALDELRTVEERAAADGKPAPIVTTPNAASSGTAARAVEQVRLTAGVHGNAAALSGEDGLALPDVPVFTRGDAFSFSLWLRPAAVAERAVVFHRSLAYTDAGSRGYELVLEQGRVAFGLHRHWPGSSLKVSTRTALPVGAWTHLTLTYDGSSRAAGAHVYVNGVPAELEVVRDKLGGDITYDRETQPPLLIGHRFRDAGFKDGSVDDFKIFPRELSALEAAHLAGHADLAQAWTTSAAALGAFERKALQDYFVRVVSPEIQDMRRELARRRRDQVRAYDAIPEVMVMEELPAPRAVHVLERGSYDQPREEVRPAPPGVLPPLPADAPLNRLGLAQWATSPANPLTARVAVNRLWQLMFERGLVETPDNFGLTGESPTHPELLDWLAVEFARHWDVKALLRQIALSATSRQSSAAGAELRERDPQNRLLARAPARRLSAEMLRDPALVLRGLRGDRRGGPPVKPAQPPGLWEEIAMGRPTYLPGTGEDLHRRSLYTFLKRTVPPPAMITFDATDRSNCTVRRQATSTPLQALVLLNDVQFFEAAKFLGARFLREGGPLPAEQVAYAFQLVTSRPPTPRETATLVRLLTEQEEHFAADPAAAAELLAVGEPLAASSGPASRLAAATLVASALLNHDEAVMRR